MAIALRSWTRSRLRIVAVVAAIGGLIGLTVSWLLSRIQDYPYDLAEVENGIRNGVVVGAALAAVDLLYVQGPHGAWLRRLGFGRAVLIRAVLFTAVIVVCFALNRIVFELLHGFERGGLEYFGLPLLRDTAIAFVAFLVISEFLQMRRVIGGRTLTNLLLGRYERPVREERVFMLVDIRGSTALAERLGDQQAHAFITSTFFDVDQPILEHDGEVYSYVGDGLIATWPLAEGIRESRCLRCAMAIRATLSARADHYRRRFGVAPTVRIALHAGPIVAGECGDTKLQIVYLGDTLNVTARIEEVAKAEELDLLVSGSLLEQMDLPSGLHARPLGPTALRGRRQPLALYALEVSDAGALGGGRPRPAAEIDRPAASNRAAGEPTARAPGVAAVE